jgi:peptide/nickel transport system ATP-binding protein
MTGPAPMLDVRDLRVTFLTPTGEFTAVDAIDFQVRAGETLVILGESGSGKSVSASVIMDILDCPPGRVDGGSIRLDGEELTTLDHRARRRINGERLAIIFQDPLAYLNPVYSVGWQVEEVYRIHASRNRQDGSDAKARALALLERVGIPRAAERFDHFPHQFSGGQRQRIMIAMALALSPKLLIADEPTTALDVTVQRQVFDLLKELQSDHGMAIVMITHDLSVAAACPTGSR